LAAQSKSWVCSRSLAGIAGSNPAAHGCVSVVSVMFCQVEISALGWSLVQRSLTCGVSECNLEASIMRKSCPTWGSWAVWKKCFHKFYWRCTSFMGSVCW